VAFAAAEPDEQQPHRQERCGEQDGTRVLVQGRGQHPVAPASAEGAEGENPQAIAQERNWPDGRGEQDRVVRAREENCPATNVAINRR
jgi:hypothetical protein